MITDHHDKSDRIDRQSTYQMPLEEVVELLKTTAQSDDRPVLLRVKPDRRVRNEPPPGPDRRRRS
jgi:hypothetical protein